MTSVFKNHTVICGWNSRGTSVVRAIRALSARTVVVVHTEIKQVVREVGLLADVFVIAGNPTSNEALHGADVGSAHSVVVLSDDRLGETADARSVEISLAVERIQVDVHTVVELRDHKSKSHFAWTKVDEVVSHEEISARMMAQAIRHVVGHDYETEEKQMAEERLLMETYQQLVSPHHKKSQLFRVDLPWHIAANMQFQDLIRAGLPMGVLPVALVGFAQHHISARAGQDAWTSWKCDVVNHPKPSVAIRSFWPAWPDGAPLGLIVLAKSHDVARTLEVAVQGSRS